MTGLAGCVTRQVGAPPPGQVSPTRLLPSPLVGQRFDVLPARSRLFVLIYRAGPLAALGHNHVIACRCITGTVYLPRNPLRASFDLRIAVDQFVVDDPALRAAEHSADFPPDVPESARQGTRHNMLGASLLRADKFPYVELRSAGLRGLSSGQSNDVVAVALVRVDRDEHSVAVPVHYDIRSNEIVASGEFSLKQTDIGLTPFSALGGALRVRNRMLVRLTIVAQRRAQ